MTDKYSGYEESPSSFGTRSRLVIPNDDADLATQPKALVVAVAGDLAVVPRANPNNEPVPFEGVPAGFVVPFLVRRVMATGTDATVYTIED